MTPSRAQNSTAYAERSVLSIKSEYTDKMIFFGETMLRRALNEFIVHYNTERPHQGIGNVVVDGAEQAGGQGEVECHGRLGGLQELGLLSKNASHASWLNTRNPSSNGQARRDPKHHVGKRPSTL